MVDLLKLRAYTGKALKIRIRNIEIELRTGRKTDVGRTADSSQGGQLIIIEVVALVSNVGGNAYLSVMRLPNDLLSCRLKAKLLSGFTNTESGGGGTEPMSSWAANTIKLI